MFQFRNKSFDIQKSRSVALGRKCVFRHFAGKYFEFSVYYGIFAYTGQTVTPGTSISDEFEKEAGYSPREVFSGSFDSFSTRQDERNAGTESALIHVVRSSA